MTQKSSKASQASLLRLFRKIHRVTASLLFVFFFFMATSGILLGLKKHSAGIILSKSYSGTTSDLRGWLPMDSLYNNAIKVFSDSISQTLPIEVDRIEIHKDKGMVKFIFAKGFWGIQLDGATGELLHIERRRADFIEKIHDGSILDYYFGTSSGLIKVIYSSIMGVSLLVFTITGFWLWYGPKRMRRNKVPESN
jgi:hypothetical protein